MFDASYQLLLLYFRKSSVLIKIENYPFFKNWDFFYVLAAFVTAEISTFHIYKIYLYAVRYKTR